MKGLTSEDKLFVLVAMEKEEPAEECKEGVLSQEQDYLQQHFE